MSGCVNYLRVMIKVSTMLLQTKFVPYLTLVTLRDWQHQRLLQPYSHGKILLITVIAQWQSLMFGFFISLGFGYYIEYFLNDTNYQVRKITKNWWLIRRFGLYLFWGKALKQKFLAWVQQCMTEAVFLTLGRSRSSHLKKLGLQPKA